MELSTTNLGFSESDLMQVAAYGIPMENCVNQLNFYKTGIPKTDLVAPAIVSNGIKKFSETEIQQKAAFFDANKINFKLVKFVPASGAASRMFQFLNEFLNDFKSETETIEHYIERKNNNELTNFINGIKKFPFFEEVNALTKKIHPNFDNLGSDSKTYYFIKTMLSADFFNFANKPKAILPFHQYGDRIATPIEEHLYECASYASSKGASNLHFTVSEMHQTAFENVIATIKGRVEQETQNQIDISFSYQNKKTDILAVDNDNNPFKDDKGNLLFRPGGHGALIDNLNNLDGDIIFVKNIDNVVQSDKEITALYKKALAGVMIELQQQLFDYLKSIDQDEATNITEILDFAANSMNIKIASSVFTDSLDNQKEYIKKILNRPIRICGMVKNEGDTGGGPFWVQDAEGTVSLQIVETAQIDLNNPSQAEIFSGSTHFNPVDLVCGTKNYNGKKFHLPDFVDGNSGFIVKKNKDGKPLKSYELPGLWNGAMAKWNTIFVEVPLLTFNPVKTVNDLLKPQHQP